MLRPVFSTVEALSRGSSRVPLALFIRSAAKTARDKEKIGRD